MWRRLLSLMTGGILITSCQSDTERPKNQKQIDQVSMRQEKPTLFDLREDKLQEERTRGRICSKKKKYRYQNYVYEGAYDEPIYYYIEEH